MIAIRRCLDFTKKIRNKEKERKKERKKDSKGGKTVRKVGNNRKLETIKEYINVQVNK